MKKLKFIAIMLGLLTLAFIYNNNSTEKIAGFQNIAPVNPPGPQGNPEFLTGAMSIGDDQNYTNAVDLKLNLWHRYTNDGLGWEGITNDLLYEPVANYFAAVDERVRLNYENGLLTYFDRPKTHHLAYGQSSTYQAEENIQNPELWFYKYENHTPGISHDLQDGNDRVRHCTTGVGQGWIAKTLIANREQCNGFWATGTHHDWYVKPRVRVLPSDVQNYPEKKICRIDIYDWDGGDPIESRILYAKNFKQHQNPVPYTGEYLQEYYWAQTQGETPSAIQLGGDALNPNRINPYDWNQTWLVDYSIWYYDEAEMWIDYVRVDNRIAHRLLKGNDPEFETWIMGEVNLAKYRAGYVHNFYIEEFEMNIIPCIKYVNDKIRLHSGQEFSLSVNVNEDILKASIPHYNHNQNLSPDFVKRVILDSISGAKEHITTNYPIMGMRLWYPHTFIPNTLPNCTNGG